MPRHLSVTLLFGALASASCTSGAERAAADKVKVFHERADAGRLAEIRQEYKPDVIGWEKWMERRHQQLGRLKRTSCEQVDDIATWGLLTMWYKSEFEEGPRRVLVQSRGRGTATHWVRLPHWPETGMLSVRMQGRRCHREKRVALSIRLPDSHRRSQAQR